MSTLTFHVGGSSFPKMVGHLSFIHKVCTRQDYPHNLISVSIYVLRWNEAKYNPAFIYKQRTHKTHLISCDQFMHPNFFPSFLFLPQHSIQWTQQCTNILSFAIAPATDLKQPWLQLSINFTKYTCSKNMFMLTRCSCVQVLYKWNYISPLPSQSMCSCSVL